MDDDGVQPFGPLAEEAETDRADWDTTEWREAMAAKYGTND